MLSLLPLPFEKELISIWVFEHLGISHSYSSGRNPMNLYLMVKKDVAKSNSICIFLPMVNVCFRQHIQISNKASTKVTLNSSTSCSA